MVEFDPFISLLRAREILLPRIPHLNNSLAEAFSVYQEVFAQLHSTLTESTRASILNDVFYEKAISNLSNDAVSTFGKKGNQKFLRFDDDDAPIVIRFKLLDKYLMSSNFPTKTALDWMAQRPIPGIPVGVRLTYGYRLDILGLRIEDAFVVLPTGRHVVNDWIWQVWGNPIHSRTFAAQSRLNTLPQVVYAHDDFAVSK